MEFSPSELKLLRLACEAWDQGHRERAALADHGEVYLDRFDQPRARPEVQIERDARLHFARLCRELNLDGSGEPDRPPCISGRYQRT